MNSKSSSQRVFNFSAGPAALPVPVLEEAQRDLLNLPGCGASVMEISHRSKPFEQILEQAIEDLSTLLQLPKGYRVLFLQGGARLQFSMIPMNLLRGTGAPADYIVTGSWSQNAVGEAKKEGEVRIAWDGKADNYDRLPTEADLQLSDPSAYIYFASNETIQGIQFSQDPAVGERPLVCDASSDFLSRPVAMDRYGLIYACAQKNAGPAGVTIVVMREELLSRSDEGLPGYLNFATHAKHNSMYNTPPTFAVYLVGLVAKWLLKEVGGLEAMHILNQKKAALLYDAIDTSGGFYRGHAQKSCRSLMNVTFRLPSEDLEAAFLAEANKRGLTALKGHRSVGGIRASIYNAMPLQGVEALRDFMLETAEQQR